MRERIVWAAVLATIMVLPGCGSSRLSEAPAERASQQPAIPIDQATVGEISGSITFEGTPRKLPVIHMDQDPVCVAKHSTPVHVEDGEVNENGTLPNAFVYVKAGADQYAVATPPAPVVLDQKGCMYGPHVLGILVGQELKIVSSDQTTHNIHPMPMMNMEWNESQPPGAAPLDRTFTKPEIMIPVKCNQHPWMKAYIGVMKNPFFAVTGDDGKFRITGLPPGKYTLEAWTATFGTQDQTVTVGPKGSETVTFAFKPAA